MDRRPRSPGPTARPSPPGGGRLELVADVAGKRLGVTRPGGRGLQRGELTHAGDGLLVVEVEGSTGHLRRALAKALAVDRVEAIGGQGQAVALAPQRDLAGRVAGDVDHLEP